MALKFVLPLLFVHRFDVGLELQNMSLCLAIGFECDLDEIGSTMRDIADERRATAPLPARSASSTAPLPRPPRYPGYVPGVVGCATRPSQRFLDRRTV
jgi:hypothetical protein